MPLRKLARITSGATPKVGTRQYYDSGSIPFLKIQDLTAADSLMVETADTHITPMALDETSAKLYPEGTVLLTMYGTIGTVRVTARPMAANQAIAAFLDLQHTDSIFLAWLLAYHKRHLESLALQTTQANISGRVLKSYRVMVPPLPEQRKIAAILSSVDEAIAATRKVIEQTRRVKEGLLQTLMTRGIGHTRFKETELGELPEEWEVVPFASLVGDRTLGTSKRGSTDGENYQLIKMGNLTWGGLDLSTVEAVDRTAELDDLQLREGDLLFNTRNTPELVGKTAVWHGPPGTAVPDNNVMRVRFTSRVLSDFICGQMAYGRGRGRLRRLAAGSTSVAAIYWKDLAKYRVAVPPLEEQREICGSVRQLDDSAERAKSTITSMNALKRGLMQDLLTGRVRVQPD